ncbi:MAG: hypothetical protein JNM84_18515 [Planctomycetes bacterium]|nr:hypothetical protein [Planctomycetota bacterium]
MGWMRTLLLGDFGNRLDISDLEGEFASMQARMASNLKLDGKQDRRIERLEQDNADLKLCVASLARLLVTKNVLAPAEVRALIEIVDPLDKR